MADGVEFEIDGAKLVEQGDRLTRKYLRAGGRAVATATKGLERSLEDATRVAVPGRLWRAWASKLYPDEGRLSNDPTGIVYVKGKGDRPSGAMVFWSHPGEIRGRQGQYLAVPLPAAGPRGRNRDLTPAQWEARTGIKLRFVHRPGHAPILVADDAVLSGRGRIAKSNTERRIARGRGSATVPIFVLLPTVRFRNTVSIPPLVDAAERRLVVEFLRETGMVRA